MPAASFMKYLLKRLKQGSYPQVFGMIFGYGRNNLNIYNVSILSGGGPENG